MKAHDDMVLLNINQIETILTERSISNVIKFARKTLNHL